MKSRRSARFTRYEARQTKAGNVRVHLWVHRDDGPRIKAYAKRLRDKRKMANS